MRESNLLNHIYRTNAALPAGVTIPPGDDMGAMRIGNQTLLVTVDQVAQGVHVDMATASLEQVGRKAITRSLSDVAAMAAKPVGAVVAVALPRDFGQHRAQQLFDAMRRAASDHHCPLIGGDIAMWDHPLLATVTIFAEPAGIEPVLRRGAQVGDAIYVTGELGGSLETVAGRTHHLDFSPRLATARALAGDAATRPSCMMDLSDGLGADLPRLCEAGGVAAEIELARLPISAAAAQAARRTGRPAWEHAVGDGEDYELLFTAPPDATLPASAAGAAITRIGTIVAVEAGGPVVRWRLADGALAQAANLGWEHRGP